MRRELCRPPARGAGRLAAGHRVGGLPPPADAGGPGRGHAQDLCRACRGGGGAPDRQRGVAALRGQLPGDLRGLGGCDLHLERADAYRRRQPGGAGSLWRHPPRGHHRPGLSAQHAPGLCPRAQADGATRDRRRDDPRRDHRAAARRHHLRCRPAGHAFHAGRPAACALGGARHQRAAPSRARTAAQRGAPARHRGGRIRLRHRHGQPTAASSNSTPRPSGCWAIAARTCSAGRWWTCSFPNASARPCPRHESFGAPVSEAGRLVEATVLRADGSEIPVEVAISVAAVPEGKIFVGHLRDITERRRADQALRDSEEQYRAIFNASADALVLRAADFSIVDVNATYEAMSGYSRAEVLGVNRVLANPPEVVPTIRGPAREGDGRRGDRARHRTRAARRPALRPGTARRAHPAPRPAACAVHRARHHAGQARRARRCATARSSTARSSVPRPTRWCCAMPTTAPSRSIRPTRR